MSSVRRRRAAISAAALSAVLTATLLAGGVAADTGDSSSEPTPAPSPSASEPAESPEPSSTPTDPTSGPQSARDPESNSYIVVVENNSFTESAKERAYQLGGEVTSEFSGVLDGFAANLTPQEAAALSVSEGIDYLERDQVVGITGAVASPIGCTTNSLGNIDDGGTGSVPLGFSINWFGTSYNSILINNNGGISLNDNRGAFVDYKDINLATTARPLILPLFTDIDTRATAKAVTFGTVADLGSDFGNKPGFCVNWVDVGEYAAPASATEKFSAQLLIVNQGNSDVDIVFNYDKVLAPTSASNGKFVIGFADPANRANAQIIATTSTDPLTLTDTGSSPLKTRTTNSSVPGRNIFQIRSGPSPTASPSPSDTPSATPTTSCPDSAPAGTQACAPWGLDRLDQRALPLDQLFTPAGAGSGVITYVVDTGIYTAHSEFTGRTATGISTVSGSSSTADCNGHGTHVAGTIAGTTYGVAKSATVVPVRVLDCSGSGYTSWVLGGLDWIRVNHSTSFPGKRAVVNMSLGGGASKVLDDAVAALVTANIPVVVAAGNSAANAVNFSPAREPSAITVGASAATDAQASFSNFGSSLDIYAPGVSIISAGISSTTAAATYSGTSMAAPHVAGAAAVFLALNPSSTANQVAIALTESASANTLTSLGSGSPNKLLYVRSFTVPIPEESSSTPPSSGGGGGGGGGSSSSEPSGGGGAALEDEITVTQPPLVTNQVSGSGEFKVIDASGNPVQLSAAGLTPNGLVVRGVGWQVESSGPLTANNTTLQPGQSITIRGSGLQRLTTTGVYILSQPTWVAAAIVSYENEFTASFLVPALAPGQHTLQINTVRQGQAPVSIAVGFTLTAGTASTSASAAKPAAASTKSLFVPFANKSAVLSATAKKRISTALTSLGAVAPAISLTGFSTKSAPPASVKLAASRMRAINAYVKTIGFGQQVTFVPTKAARTPQTRGVLIRATG